MLDMFSILEVLCKRNQRILLKEVRLFYPLMLNIERIFRLLSVQSIVQLSFVYRLSGYGFFFSLNLWGFLCAATTEKHTKIT